MLRRRGTCRNAMLIACTTPDAYRFVLLSHETHGRLGQPAMDHFNRLAEVAKQCVSEWCGGRRYRGVFLTNALRRLSVALCKGNAYVLRAGLQSLAGITGRAMVRARARPSDMTEWICEWIPTNGSLPSLCPV